MPYNSVAGSIHIKKLCSRLSSSEEHFLTCTLVSLVHTVQVCNFASDVKYLLCQCYIFIFLINQKITPLIINVIVSIN